MIDGVKTTDFFLMWISRNSRKFGQIYKYTEYNENKTDNNQDERIIENSRTRKTAMPVSIAQKEFM